MQSLFQKIIGAVCALSILASAQVVSTPVKSYSFLVPAPQKNNFFIEDEPSNYVLEGTSKDNSKIRPQTIFAIGLAAFAITSVVLAVTYHEEATDVQEKYDELSNISSSLLGACKSEANPKVCENIVNQKGEHDGWALSNLQKRMKENKDIVDDRTFKRNIWIAVGASSLLGAIVIYKW